MTHLQKTNTKQLNEEENKQKSLNKENNKRKKTHTSTHISSNFLFIIFQPTKTTTKQQQNIINILK